MSAVESKVRKERMVHSAREKAEAVLALWTGRRRPTEVCQELAVKATVLGYWQHRALEGMLSALEPRTRAEEDRGPMLPENLEKLLGHRMQQRDGKIARLTDRLEKIQRQKERTPAKASS